MGFHFWPSLASPSSLPFLPFPFVWSVSSTLNPVTFKQWYREFPIRCDRQIPYTTRNAQRRPLTVRSRTLLQDQIGSAYILRSLHIGRLHFSRHEARKSSSSQIPTEKFRSWAVALCGRSDFFGLAGAKWVPTRSRHLYVRFFGRPRKYFADVGSASPDSFATKNKRSRSPPDDQGVIADVRRVCDVCGGRLAQMPPPGTLDASFSVYQRRKSRSP